MDDNIISIPADIIFPDELNRFLREKITSFIHENGILTRNLEEKEQKCNQMKKQLQELKTKIKDNENLIPELITPNSINTKIVELSKTIREKCSELEKYKTKCSKLINHIEELQRQENIQKPPAQDFEKNKISENETQSEIKHLQDKLNATTNKFLDIKNHNIQLKNELKQTNKFLQQEIGEDISYLQANASWKGRAQIICDLQEKNKKLREKLKDVKESKIPQESSNSETKISGKLESLAKENAALKLLNEKFKNKIEVLKARYNVLDMEHQDLKAKIETINKGSTKDMECIATLSNQLSEAENVRRNEIREKDILINNRNTEIEKLVNQIEKYKVMVTEIKGKKENITNETCKIANNRNMENDSNTIYSKEQRVIDKNLIVNLKEEKHKLLEILEKQKKTLDTERDEHARCENLLRLEKQKSVKLEMALAKSDLESSSTHRSSYSSMSQSSQRIPDIKDQLQLADENIKALTTRLLLEQHERKVDFEEFSKILKISKTNI